MKKLIVATTFFFWILNVYAATYSCVPTEKFKQMTKEKTGEDAFPFEYRTEPPKLIVTAKGKTQVFMYDQKLSDNEVMAFNSQDGNFVMHVTPAKMLAVLMKRGGMPISAGLCSLK